MKSPTRSTIRPNDRQPDFGWACVEITATLTEDAMADLANHLRAIRPDPNG